MLLLRSFLLTLLISQCPAEVITLVANNRSVNSGLPSYSAKTITLVKGETATANFVSNEAFVDATIAGTLIRIDANDPGQANLPVVTGPATIRLSNFTTANAALATFTVQRLGESEPVPGQIVVIPDDGSGEHEVFLESSTDMVTWSKTTAGLFNSTNASRFFRVRVAKN